MPQAKRILVINCGSSSLKYEVYIMPEKKSLGKGLVERIGLDKGKITQKTDSGTFEEVADIPDHRAAMELVKSAITHDTLGMLQEISMIDGVGHRVVHGGEDYAESVVIDDKVIKAIEDNSELAPLHNPANLTGIREAIKMLPNIAQVAVFDTAFHQTMPASAYLYGLPRELYNEYKIRRYGFHGTSHRYVAGVAMKMLKRVPENTNMITCHLGNGASITAIQHGESVDTSMGFTPLEGLLMGTRSGDIDPSIIFYLSERGYSNSEISTMLNKKSGLLGISEVSSDLRDVEEAAEAGNKEATEALEVFAYRVRKYIGAYSANLVRVDAIVFTGGIGEHAIKMRKRICRNLQNIGIHMDKELNEQVGHGVGTISHPYSPTQILVIPTNEELQIALDSYELIFE